MKRAVLCLLFAVLLFHPLVSRAEAETCVAVASDLHYLAPSLTDGGSYYQRVLANGDSKFMPYIEEITDAFLEEMLALKPDALLLTGDLTFNGAVISHEALAAKLRILTAAGIPVFVLTGNHDLYNANAARFQGDGFSHVPFATTEIFEQIYEEFGRREALSADPDSLSYVVQLSDSVRVLMLDFNTLHNWCGLPENSFGWIERQLQSASESGMEVLAAGHQNLFQHSIFRDGYVIDGAQRLSELLRNYGVRIFLSGHLHIQHVQTEDGLTEIAGSALCSYPCQYGLLKVEDRGLQYETRQLDMAAWAERNKREEDIFSDFQAAAAEYMRDHFRASPPPGEALTPTTAGVDLRERLLSFLQTLNLAYFSGDLRTAAALDPDQSLATIWLNNADPLTAGYIASIIKEYGQDFTKWTQ